MNYYELIYLKKSLEQKVVGAKLTQVLTPHKNVLEFHMSAEQPCRLVFSGSPGNTALFIDTPRPSKKKNALTFFDELYGESVSNVTLAERDRWLMIHFNGGKELRFRLFSHKANVLLVDDGVVVESFKDFGEEGKLIKPPRPAELFKKSGGESAKEIILQLNPMFPREELEMFADVNGLDKMEESEISALLERTHDTLLEDAEPRILKTGEVTLIPHNLLAIGSERVFDSVNDLVAYRYKSHSKRSRLLQQKSQLQKAIKRKLKRVRSSLRQLNRVGDGQEKAERFEQLGHILLANAHMDTGDQKKMVLSDLFNDGEEIEVPVDPQKSVSDNAEEYYKKARQSLESFKQAKKRIPELESQLELFSKLNNELDSIHDLFELQDWINNHEDVLNEIRSGSGNSTDNQNLPFHVIQMPDSEVWIGKNAKSNDKLLRSAHKEDIWLHARGVPGSHVVIRMANNKEMPQKEVIIKAASYAAYNSKAKGSALVPVIYTKCKFVRKPKGAPAGAVLVQKENVEMVEPVKPEYE